MADAFLAASHHHSRSMKRPLSLIDLNQAYIHAFRDDRQVRRRFVYSVIRTLLVDSAQAQSGFSA